MASPVKEQADAVSFSNIESNTQGEVISQEEQLRRDFKPRQVFMFSIACAIGTGLIIGSGSALAKGGPGNLLISYCLIGAAVFFVMTSLGEMAAFVPMNKGFSGYATRMVDPAFGFATGWNYFIKYIVVTPTNLTAAGLVIQYWRPDLNVAIWVATFGAAIIIINILHVNSFGETEFWFGLCKIIVMTTMILTCLIISLGGGPNHYRSGFKYWQEPGAFAQYLLEGRTGYLLGFWACICQALFAFIGCEVVGMTFGETPNPRKNILKAVKQTFWRIAVFYIIGVLVLGMAVPHDDDRLLGATKQSTSAAASPFVVAVNIAGIRVLPDIINASMLVFTLSAASSDIYCASRSLYGLARDGQAPKIFCKTLGSGNPIWAVAASAMFIALGFMNASKSASTVFGYLVSLVTIFAVWNWVALLVSYLSFRRALKAQGIPLSELPYVGMLQPYGAYYALFISILIIIFSGYDAFIPHFKPDILVLKYIGTLIFLANVTWWKLYKGTKWVSPSEVNLATGRWEFDNVESPTN
ncbi:hypothetical protein NM208_g8688 [Fusarium decemcellulare]|uniref:Uncharacterized protein n=2 Tax=Fusarium decemcellulare TaxID=57161 RepID=A0ACC1S4H3_9HYPO|nr:hypothetical protein NM208_g12311 [Fusarium decemcellulare]KAJ3531866.1 hypothetical protein NM208_g8688 [Fusarium decemcellulare]